MDSSIIQRIINNLPSFDTLRKLTTLQIHDIPSDCSSLLLQKFNFKIMSKPIMIQKLELKDIGITYKDLSIINDCMININHLHVDGILIYVENKDEENDINISNLLQRLSSIHINTSNGCHYAKRTLYPYFITRLLMLGNIKNCGRLYIDKAVKPELLFGQNMASRNLSDFVNDMKMTENRNYLKSLHFHGNNYESIALSHYASLFHSVRNFTALTELCMNCDINAGDIISKIIPKCKKLQSLSLKIYPNFYYHNFLLLCHCKKMETKNSINYGNQYFLIIHNQELSEL